MKSRWQNLIEDLRASLESLGETVRTDWQDGEDADTGITICYGKRKAREEFRPPRIIVYPDSADVRRSKQPQQAIIAGRNVKGLYDREIRVVVEIHTSRTSDERPSYELDRLADNVWVALTLAGYLPNNIQDETVGELYPTEVEGQDAYNIQADVALLTFAWDQPIVYLGPSDESAPVNVSGLNMPATEIKTTNLTGVDYVDE